MNLHKFMLSYEVKNDKTLFKQQFLKHLDEVLSKISVVEFLYQSIN
jgi:hypothetical protein